MKLKEGDKILCRRTHIIKTPNKNTEKVIWKFGKKYKINDISYSKWNIIANVDILKYNIESEDGGETINEKELKIYFLVDEKRVRKFKLIKLRNKNEKG